MDCNIQVQKWKWLSVTALLLSINLIHWNLFEMKVLLYWAVNLCPPISHHWPKNSRNSWFPFYDNYKPDQSVGHFPPIILLPVLVCQWFPFSLVERVKEPIWGIFGCFLSADSSFGLCQQTDCKIPSRIESVSCSWKSWGCSS